MAAIRRSEEPIDWDSLELQAFNLKFEPLSKEDLLRKAKELAATFRYHNEPLPVILEQIPGLIPKNEGAKPSDPE